MAGEGKVMSDDYRRYVEKLSNAGNATEVILNRSSEHAAVVVEFLFRRAEYEMEILTNELAEDVYGVPGVIAAAQSFLERNLNASIHILAEKPVVRASHPLLRSLDQSGLGDRVHLAFIPEATQKTYNFNFAVADQKSYRFEETRTTREAIVQFGDAKFGAQLHSVFGKLSVSVHQVSA